MDAREIFQRSYEWALAEGLQDAKIEELGPEAAEEVRGYAEEYAWGEVEAAYALGCVRRPSCRPVVGQ